MANPFTQYLKDTRTELNHVAWPTQRQTAVFTALVAAISLGVAAYVGALDYAFKDALFAAVDLSGNANAQNAIQVTQQPAVSTSTTHAASGPTFNIVPHTAPSTGSSKTAQ